MWHTSLSPIGLLILAALLSNYGLQTLSPGLDRSMVVLSMLVSLGAVLVAVRVSSAAKLARSTALLDAQVVFLVSFLMLFSVPYWFDFWGLTDLSRNRFLQNTYFENSNKALLLSTTGALAYTAGVVFALRLRGGPLTTNRLRGICSIHPRQIPFFQVLALGLLIVSLLLVVVTGASSMFSGAYTGQSIGNNRQDGSLFLASHFSIVCVSALLAASPVKNAPALVGAASGLWWAGMLILSGDRNSALLILLPMVAGYGLWSRRIGLVTLLALCAVGYIVYEAVEYFRLTPDRTIIGLASAIFSVFSDRSDTGGFGESSFSLTTTTVRAGLHEYNYGEAPFGGWFKIVGLLGVIPFSRSMLETPIDGFYTSAQYLTWIVVGADPSWSIGSNIITDLVLDFGATGFVLVMGLIGYTLTYARLHLAASIDFSARLLYLVVLTYTLQWPRYSFDFPARSIVWLIFMLIAVRLFSKTSHEGR